MGNIIAANLGVTPALRRRRERAERQRSFIREQQETAAILRKSSSGDVAEDAIQDSKYIPYMLVAII
jgi:hypothetical protein